MLGLVGASAAVRADQDDQDRALEAVRRGEILPLSTILGRLRTIDQGQMLEVELEHERGRWIYEVKTLSADGVVRKRVLDARTGALLSPHEDD
ncbi:MAG: PepSY domain-containing protein [Geminicoccaceae bacterium]